MRNRKILLAMILSLGATAGAGWAQEPEPAPGGGADGIVSEPVEQARPDHAEELSILMERLGDPDLSGPGRVEARVMELWDISGSDSADLLLRRGRDAMNRGELEVAVEHLSALVEQAPGFAEGWNTRATAFFMQEEYGLSMLDIERALALNPQHFGALAGLGFILEETGEARGALMAFRAAQALNPHRPQVNDAVERLAAEVDGSDI